MRPPVTVSNIQHTGLGQKIGQAQFFVSAVQIHIILMYLQITLDIVARRVVDFEAVRSEENELPAASRNVAAGCSCRWPGATLSRAATVHCDFVGIAPSQAFGELSGGRSHFSGLPTIRQVSYELEARRAADRPYQRDSGILSTISGAAFTCLHAPSNG